MIDTDEDPSLRIESFVIINLRNVRTKLYFNLIFIMQTYKELITSQWFGKLKRIKHITISL